jgi:hypothetical protein
MDWKVHLGWNNIDSLLKVIEFYISVFLASFMVSYSLLVLGELMVKMKMQKELRMRCPTEAS